MTVHDARDIAATLTGPPIALPNTRVDRDHIGSNGRFPETQRTVRLRDAFTDRFKIG